MDIWKESLRETRARLWEEVIFIVEIPTEKYMNIEISFYIFKPSLSV